MQFNKFERSYIEATKPVEALDTIISKPSSLTPRAGRNTFNCQTYPNFINILNEEAKQRNQSQYSN